ncbi:MAG: hypothetical protein NVSMB3_00830 [Acidobacteriaceae bacterium]
MLFVTFHGGHPEHHAHLNNVHAYDKEGRRLSAGVLKPKHGVVLNELRGICLRGGLLYVVNANQLESSVVCYHGEGLEYEYVSTFASRESCPGMVHPFEITFDDAGFAYVSSQDTNVVTRLKVSADGRTGTPAALAPALEGKGDFLPGTFVASSERSQGDLPTTAMAPPAGLQFSGEGRKKHSVRGVLWTSGALYVVDQPAGRVKVYDGDGKFLGQSNRLDSPVHLLLHHRTMYVSGGNKILIAGVPERAGDFELTQMPGLRVKNGCGMAFSHSGNLYIASRTLNQIHKLDTELRPMRFECELPDNPEFLLSMP